jgi:hypothetical protein
MKKIIITLVLVCAALSISAQRTINLNDKSANVSLQKRARSTVTAAELQGTYTGEVKNFRPFAMNPLLQKPGNVSVGDTIILELLEDTTFKAVVKSTDLTYEGWYWIHLTLPFDGSKNEMTHIVTTPEGKFTVAVKDYSIRTSSDGQAYLVKLDRSKASVARNSAPESQRQDIAPYGKSDMVEMPPDIDDSEAIGINLEVDSEGNTISHTIINPQKKKSISALASPVCSTLPVAGENPDAPATIDVLLVYTPAVEAKANAIEPLGITYLLHSLVYYSNIAFANSDTDIELVRVRSERVEYTEPMPYDMHSTLARLQTPGDGYMDEVHSSLRGAPYNADLVQLITMENDFGGVAPTLNTVNGRHEAAFSVANVKVLENLFESENTKHLTSIHEMGHNFGLAHSAQMIEPAGGLFPYSYGWRFQEPILMGGQYYTTIMGYEEGIHYGDANYAYRIPYFSSPDLIYRLSLGGNALSADATRSLKEIKHVIASYSDRLTTFPSVPTGITVSSVATNGATFSWDMGANIDEYRVYIYVNGKWTFYNVLTNPTTTSMAIYGPELSSGTTYEFYVRAINACGNVMSRAQTFTTVGTATGLQPTPAKEILATDCYSVTGIKIDCDNDAQGVIIRRNTFTDGSTEVIKEMK